MRRVEWDRRVRRTFLNVQEVSVLLLSVQQWHLHKDELHSWRVECGSSWACSHRRFFFELSGVEKRCSEILQQYVPSVFCGMRGRFF